MILVRPREISRPLFLLPCQCKRSAVDGGANPQAARATVQTAALSNWGHKWFSAGISAKLSVMQHAAVGSHDLCRRPTGLPFLAEYRYIVTTEPGSERTFGPANKT